MNSYRQADGVDRFVEKDNRITYSITFGKGSSRCVVLKGNWITLHPISKLDANQARYLATLLVMAANDLERKERGKEERKNGDTKKRTRSN